MVGLLVLQFIFSVFSSPRLEGVAIVSVSYDELDPP